jgi:hypothetical protein
MGGKYPLSIQRPSPPDSRHKSRPLLRRTLLPLNGNTPLLLPPKQRPPRNHRSETRPLLHPRLKFLSLPRPFSRERLKYHLIHRPVALCGILKHRRRHFPSRRRLKDRI